MARSTILTTLVICFTLVNGHKYDRNCQQTAIFIKQADKDVAFLRTTAVINNASVSAECKSDQACTMHYCVANCIKHNATVCARFGKACFIHNHDNNGWWNLLTMDEVLIRNEVNFVKGKSYLSLSVHFIGTISKV